MRVRITLISDADEVFEGELDLLSRSNPKSSKKPARTRTSAEARGSSTTINLELPLRPFLKAYAQGKSGAAKLTLLIAHIAQGKTDVPVDSGDLQAAWNRTTAFLGEYNRAHSTRAKDNGWIDSSKHGQYILRPSWKEAAN